MKTPRAVLFDLFHTLVNVPRAQDLGQPTVAELLGVPSVEFHRRYYDDDELGRCVGSVRDGLEAMRRVAHSIDPSIGDECIAAAEENRRRRFRQGLVEIHPPVLTAIDRLRAAGIRLAIVSDAGLDDVEAWPHSPLRDRFDVTVFSYELGVRKPARAIYEHALAALGVQPADALFVGDGGSDEHRGARAVGMESVLVTRLIERPTPEKIAERRLHADWELEDVAAFVDALMA